MGINKTSKDELIINVDSSSLESIDKFIDLLKSNNVEVKALERDEYVIKL